MLPTRLHPDCGTHCPLEEEEGAVLQKWVGLVGGAVCCRHEEALTLLCSEVAGLQMVSHLRFLVVQKAVEVGGDRFAQMDSGPKGAVSQREAEEVGLTSRAWEGTVHEE